MFDGFTNPVDKLVPDLPDKLDAEDPWASAETEEDVSSVGPQGTLGVTTAVLNMVTCVVGAAIFNLPAQAKKSGILMALMLLLVSMLLSVETGSLWSAVSVRWNQEKGKKECLYITSFERFGQAAYGTFGRISIMVLNNIFYIGACGGYAIFIGNTLHASCGWGGKWHPRWTRLFLGPVYLCLAMLNDLSALSKLAPVGTLAACLGCLVLIIKGSVDYGSYKSWDDIPLAAARTDEETSIYSWWPERGFIPVGSAIAFMFMSYGVMGLIPTTATAMREPQKMPLALWIMGIVVFVLYATVIITCYGAYGNFLAALIENLKKYPANYAEAKSVITGDSNKTDGFNGKEELAWFYMASISVIVSLVLAYPFLMMTVFCSIQETDFATVRAPPGSWANRGMRACIVTLTLLIALAIDNFGDVFDLFASLCLPLMNVAIPIAYSWKLRNILEMPHPHWLRLVYHGVFGVFGIFAGIFGTIDSIKNIAAQYK